MLLGLLLFAYCVYGTCALQTCEKTIPMQIQTDIKLRNRSDLKELCYLPSISSCPYVTNCTEKIGFCSVNSSSIKAIYCHSEVGHFFIESEDGIKPIHLGNKGCKATVANKTKEIIPEDANGRNTSSTEIVANKTEEIKPEDTNGRNTAWLTSISVAGVVFALTIAIVGWKRRWCRRSNKRSFNGPSNSTTPESGSLIGESSSTNTSLELQQKRQV